MKFYTKDNSEQLFDGDNLKCHRVNSVSFCVWFLLMKDILSVFKIALIIEKNVQDSKFFFSSPSSWPGIQKYIVWHLIISRSGMFFLRKIDDVFNLMEQKCIKQKREKNRFKFHGMHVRTHRSKPTNYKKREERRRNAYGCLTVSNVLVILRFTED